MTCSIGHVELVVNRDLHSEIGTIEAGSLGRTR